MPGTSWLACRCMCKAVIKKLWHREWQHPQLLCRVGNDANMYFQVLQDYCSATTLRHSTPNLNVHISWKANYGSLAQLNVYSTCATTWKCKENTGQPESARGQNHLWTSALRLTGHPSAENYFLNDSKAKFESNVTLACISRHHKIITPC